MLPTLESTCYADQLERSFRGGAWHGPSLAEGVAGLEAVTAGWRPAPGTHCIAELVGHVAFWMDDVRQKLAGSPPQESPQGSDWARVDACLEPDWRARVAALEEAHLGLKAAVESLPEGRLDLPVAGSDATPRGLILGILQHNAYHGGQILLLRKQAERAVRGGP